MSRQTNQAFAEFLRQYGNEDPSHGFTLGELLTPVVIVDDASALHRRLSGVTVGTRLYRAALAGSYSIGAVTAGAGGVHIQFWEADGNMRVTMRNDGDQISANRAAVDPPIGSTSTTTLQRQSSIYVGTHNADPNGGTEFFQVVAGDRLEDIYVPPNHSFITYGIAANQVATGWIMYREGIDG